ncbi:hypothetical protein D3C87_552650 [compost metagenome]
MDYAIIKKIMLDCFKIEKIRYDEVPVLTVAHDNDRSLLHKGKYYSPLIDTMEDDLAQRGVACISVARIISTVKGELSYARVYSPEGAFARALVVKRLLAKFTRAAYPYSAMEERIWGDILDQTKAKKVFGIQPSRELCVACHKRGVWVADVQHGVIAETHPWYGASFRAADPIEYLPNAFLCWDEGSAEVIREWAAPKGVATNVIGNRWLARFTRPAANDALVRELSADYQLRTVRDERKTVMMSLSWGCTNIPNGFIGEELEQVIRKTASTYRWLLRLHPNQIQGFATHEGPNFIKYFDQSLRGYAEWELATRAPLPVVLRDIDLHVSWNSSVCIEAAQVGIKSALLDPNLRADESKGDYYSYYKKAGLVELISESEASLTAWLAHNIDSKRPAESFDAFDERYVQLLDFLAK